MRGQVPRPIWHQETGPGRNQPVGEEVLSRLVRGAWTAFEAAELA